jgi:ankyrin repeat protein
MCGADVNYGNERKPNRDLPIYLAVVDGNQSLIALLCCYGADATASSTIANSTALHYVIRENQAETLQLLLEFGTDPNASALRPNPLLLAIDLGLDNVVRLLLSFCADPNAPGLQSNPLLLAIDLGLENVVRLLLAFGADPLVANTRLPDPRMYGNPYENMLHAPLNRFTTPTCVIVVLQFLKEQQRQEELRQRAPKPQQTPPRSTSQEYGKGWVVNSLQ